MRAFPKSVDKDILSPLEREHLFPVALDRLRVVPEERPERFASFIGTLNSRF